jgi:hypothetical protein
VDESTTTVLLGVVAFVFGQAVIRFLLDPIQEQKRIIGEIIHAQILFDHALPSFQDAETRSQQQNDI